MMRKLALLALIALCVAAPSPHLTALAENVAHHDQKNLDAIRDRIRVAFRIHRIAYMGLGRVKDHIEVTILDPKRYKEASGVLLALCADKQSSCSVKLLPDEQFQVTPSR